MIEGLNTSWIKHLASEFEKDYFKELCAFIETERREHSIFPPAELTFSALNKKCLEEVKVVILGQDPYHNHGQANGLSFSVANGMKIPPSFKKYFQGASK